MVDRILQLLRNVGLDQRLIKIFKIIFCTGGILSEYDLFNK